LLKELIDAGQDAEWLEYYLQEIPILLGSVL